MSIRYTDEEIRSLLEESKRLPENYTDRVILRDKRGHREHELDADGAKGHTFKLLLRQSLFNPLDFSVILALCPDDTTNLFRLIRYNGKSHEHTNRIEGETFYEFHIHVATERYQRFGPKEDEFAEPTDRFSDFHGALRCMLLDNGFELPRGFQGSFL